MNKFIHKILNASHTFEPQERLLMYKFQTLMALIVLSSFVVFVMMFIRYLEGNYKQAIADLIFILVTFFGSFLLRRCKHYYYVVARSVLFSGLLIEIWLLHAVPESQSRIIWFSMTIAIMFFMLNKKEGFYWLGTLIFILSAIFISSDFLHLKFLDFAIFIVNLIMLAMVLLWYESIKDDNELYLKNHASTLEMEIANRTKELKDALKEAQTAQKAKDVFFANMSHELRTPLNSIIGFSQILSRQKDVPETIQSFIEKINISGNNLLKVINTILNFSKIESNKMLITKEDINIKNFMIEIIHSVQPQANKKNITIHTQIEENSIHGDKQLLSQALFYLLSNAIKYSHNKTEISIISKKENGHFFIKIIDHGIGVSQENKEKLFQPFSQIKHNAQAEVDGTGLGLYLTKKIIELHNGKIELESEVDKGSTFGIFI